MANPSSPVVEVVLALSDVCHRQQLILSPGETIESVVARSELPLLCLSATGQAPAAYGIYGRKVAPDHRPVSGDRIELLRPLETDPKSARRDRAQKRAR